MTLAIIILIAAAFGIVADAGWVVSCVSGLAMLWAGSVIVFGGGGEVM